MQLIAEPKSEMPTSGGSSWGTIPAPDQIEVSLFGPGFGECVLIHIGGGKWVVVDSCIDADTGSAVALNYLRSLGVDCSTAVLAIVATHWHDDHIRGLAEIVGACPKSKFVCSSAMTTKEFDAMVLAFDGQRMVRASTGVAEVNRVFELLQDKARPRARYAIAGRTVFHFGADKLGAGRTATCTALSPSDYDDQEARVAFGRLIPREKETQYRCPADQPNLFSVALHLSIGGTHVLLGADLENVADIRRGWQAVLLDKTLPVNRSVLFKIPHHGGKSAFNSDVWSNLLETTPIAVTSPWQRAGRRLPSSDDIQRIASCTPLGFLTADPEVAHSPAVGRPAAVLRQIREMGARLTRIEPPSGAVRFRKEANASEWTFKLYNSAMQITATPTAR